MQCESEKEGNLRTFHIYSRHYDARTVVTLGSANGAEMYSVFVKRSLPSPYTVTQKHRTTTSYQAEDAAIENGTVATTLSGFEGTGYVVVHEPHASLRWKVQVGVSSHYQLAIRYAQKNKIAANGTMKIIDADGNVVDTIPIVMNPSDEWNTVKYETHTGLNAGNYTVQLNLSNTQDLAVDALQVTQTF
jgi:hypothetical protein